MKRQDLIRYLKQLGFSEPTKGGSEFSRLPYVLSSNAPISFMI